MPKILFRIAAILVTIVLFMALAAQTAADPIIGTAIVEPAFLGSNLAFDQRYTELDAFFTKHKCPYRNTSVYIDAADKNNLDWRLLPAISVAESSCGLHYLKNNIFGWNSDKTGFSSIEQGLDFVANQLATNHYYKNKTVKQILNNYNPNSAYAKKVIGLMNQIESLNGKQP